MISRQPTVTPSIDRHAPPAGGACRPPIRLPDIHSLFRSVGTIAFAAGEQVTTTGEGSSRNPANLAATPGFAIYLAGTITHVGLNALPAAGTVWSLRDYVGLFRGGRNIGPYDFSRVTVHRPMTAVGAEVAVRSSVSHSLLAATDGSLRRVHTVPDPFYLRGQFEEGRGVQFVNLPDVATIRIYTAAGNLIRLLERNSLTSDDTFWDLKSRNGQRVASGVYFYHVESRDARRVGRLTVVNYAN